MQKPIKSKDSYPVVRPPEATDDRGDIARIVEDILAVLSRHDAEPTDGVLSLLTALMQASHRVMEVSTPEESEHNRAALVAMLEHGRRFVETWPQETPSGWMVH